MKVRTKRTHNNSYPPVPTKKDGQIYSLPDAEAQTLIDALIVEEVTDENDVPEGGVSGTGEGADRGTTEGDSAQCDASDGAKRDEGGGNSGKGSRAKG